MEDNFEDSLCKPVRKLKALAELFNMVGDGDDCVELYKLFAKNADNSYGIADHLEDIANEISEIGHTFGHIESVKKITN